MSIAGIQDDNQNFFFVVAVGDPAIPKQDEIWLMVMYMLPQSTEFSKENGTK